MFSQYSKLNHHAISKESQIKTSFDSKREHNTIMIQKKLKEETDNISRNQQLKDYNPVQYYNQLTILKHKHEEIITEENTELDKLQKSIDEKMIQTMKHKPTLPIQITEISRIIAADNSHPRYVCRVYFTLIQTTHAKPGDPIRVEWVDLLSNEINDDKRQKYACHIRTAPGINGLQIPQFSSPGQITSYNSVYNPDIWGPNSQQKQWWINWIKQNRPIPE